MEESVVLSKRHYMLLAGMAAQLEGETLARKHIDGERTLHPGDPFGAVISKAWQLDPVYASSVMVSFMKALRDRCRAANATPPSLDQILGALPLVLDTSRFPDVDPKALTRQLAIDVPLMYSERI